jgi:hypothetical protein
MGTSSVGAKNSSKKSDSMTGLGDEFPFEYLYTTTNGHREVIGPKGLSSEWFALVHHQINAGTIPYTPGAVEALLKEWNKLVSKVSWLMETVSEKEVVAAEARRRNKPVHFGDLLQLCHIKNHQFDISQRSYTGRIVFRRDNVKDEHGQFAVFSEHGTSASHLMAARVVDALAHMPGRGGEDADATGAYTQIDLGSDCPDTWITLPKDKWPLSWKGKFEKAVVRLKRNLY